MTPLVLNLVDRHFTHDEYCVAGVRARNIRWDRTLSSSAPTVITHEMMYRFDYSQIQRDQRYGLLLESQAVIPRVYARVEQVIEDYELVFTHSERLLSKFSNTRWIPGGGVWVGGSYGGGAFGVPSKSRDVSMLTSSKMATSLHRKRYLWSLLLEKGNSGVDIFRQRLGSSDTVKVYETLEAYRYSIVIENFVDDRYFTEKVLNCFATGTVPIYLGARKIAKYFDRGGFIQFRNLKDLRTVLSSVSPEDYARRGRALSHNLQLVEAYRSVEDFIYERYLSNRGA